MNFGIRVPFDIFFDKSDGTSQLLCESFGGSERLFSFLKEQIDTVEISVIRCKTDGDKLKQAVAICKSYGLNVTFHGSLNEVTSAEEFFAPYLPLFEAELQGIYNITVHPFSNPQETVKLLSEICVCIENQNYPVRITLENQRYADEKFRQTLCTNVSEMVSEINSRHLYICFDFGHQHSNKRKCGDDFDVPDEKFFSAVKHTHIHSWYNGVTHFPLNCGETDLEYNLGKLMEHNYDGVYLLELAPDRFSSQFDLKESIAASISILKTAAHQTKIKQSTAFEYKNNYICHINSILENMEKSKCGMGVLGPAMYILKFGETKIAVDPSMWDFPFDEKSRESLLKLLKTCDAVVITHTHSDHFDPEIIKALPSDVTCFIPDFIQLDKENKITTKDGFRAAVSDVELSFYESAHGTLELDVREYGFCISYGGKKYAFPTDVRSYKKRFDEICAPDALIAHLWLGKRNALNLHNNIYIDEFCGFVNGFNAKRVYVSHLFDFRRTIEDMWTDIHYNYVSDKISHSEIIKLGDWINL